MANLAAKIACAIALSQSNYDAADPKPGQATDTVTVSRGPNFSDGSGDNQANIFYHDTRTIASGGEEHDLAIGASIKDAFGNNMSLTKLKGLVIVNLAAVANLLVGGAVATQVGLFSVGTSILEIPAGGMFVWTAPKAAGLDVTTNFDLKIAHDGGGNEDYEIYIIGID